MRSAACLLLLCLLAAFVSHAGEMTAVDPLDEEWALREAQEQQRVEIMEALLRWRQEGLVRRAMNNKKCAEAEEAEIEAIAHADRSFDERDYRKARERYRKALRIRFTQWAPTGATHRRGGKGQRRHPALHRTHLPAGHSPDTLDL